MDFVSLIHSIVDPLVLKPEALLIREMPSTSNHEITLLIVAENDDTARLIGKRGTVANAIRDVMAVAGKLEKKRIHLKFESFDSNK